jgi:hypothetical protein
MGTPGHMAHPFDVERVQTGQDLIDYINDAVLQLQAGDIAGSVKWDGINTSFKLVTNEDGAKDFRVDRGTSEISSVVGLTAADAYKKWPKGHGMPPAIEKLLTIFNLVLPSIESELKQLEMWDDPTKYFNTEYIEGKSNVHEYDANILAIHGINQFYEKKAQAWRVRSGKSMHRPGLVRPVDSNGKPVTANGIEIPYRHNALISIIKKVKPVAAKYGFEIYGDVPVEFDPEIDLDLEQVLETPVSIQIAPGNIETAPLRSWLQRVKHPRDKKITKVTKTGEKSVGALSKDVYLAVLRSAAEDGIPLSEYLVSEKDIDDAIDGGIFYHATRILGQAVKKSLTSEAGNLSRHEGVVLRGLEDFLVKLTGDFIVQGLASTHGDHVSENLLHEFTIVVSKDREITKPINEWLAEARSANHTYQKLPEMVYKDILSGTPIVDIVVQEDAEKAIYNTVMGYINSLQEEEEFEFEIEDEDADPVVDLEAEKPITYAIIPGAFKPPHAGHADMVKRYATGLGVEKADEVYVVISAPQESLRLLRDGTAIDEKHALALWKKLFPEVANLSNVNFEVAPKTMRSPITVAFEYISERSTLPLKVGDKVILGASDKPDDKGNPDWMRWLNVDEEKHVKQGVELLAGEAYAVPAYERPSGGSFSATTMRDLISDLIEDPAKAAYDELSEFVPANKIKTLFKTLGKVPPTNSESIETIDELSPAMAVGGFPQHLPPLRRQKKKKQQENIDLTLIDDVIRLIMEKGILQ